MGRHTTYVTRKGPGLWAGEGACGSRGMVRRTAMSSQDTHIRKSLPLGREKNGQEGAEKIGRGSWKEAGPGHDEWGQRPEQKAWFPESCSGERVLDSADCQMRPPSWGNWFWHFTV